MKNFSPVAAIWIAWFVTAANLIAGKYATPYVTSALFLFLSCVGALVCFTPHLNKTGGWKLLFDKKLFWQYLGLGTLGTGSAHDGVYDCFKLHHADQCGHFKPV